MMYKFTKFKTRFLLFIAFVNVSQLLLAQISSTNFAEKESLLNNVFLSSENNEKELKKFLQYYTSTGDSLKIQAAEFLLMNMNHDRFSYTGEVIAKYDTILTLFAALRGNGIYVGDPPLIVKKWNELKQSEGRLNKSYLDKVYDYSKLSSTFLIENTDIAFKSWIAAPKYISRDFNTFCNYVLPYRIGSESVENYRKSYYSRYKDLVDSAKTPEELLKAFNIEFKHRQHFKSSSTLWDHPLDFSISQMELGQRGACRQLTNYCALVMRACGLPVTVDRAIWANRNVGHAWNVLLLDSNRILPFDDFAPEKIEFVYKPAKIFRTRYSSVKNYLSDDEMADMPDDLIDNYEEDVTDEYCKAYDISVPITQNHSFSAHKKLGVICVFDNNDWRIVHYGTIDSGSIHFLKMASDVAYLSAFYENGTLIPASEPFLLRDDGKIQFCSVSKTDKQKMVLNRKFPMFKRVEDFAWGLRRANFETSDSPDFKERNKHFSIYDIPYQIADSIVKIDRPYRYIRMNISTTRNANLAEIEFFGKLNGLGSEVKLKGDIIGYPMALPGDETSFSRAMDGNLETWFEKRKDSVGWVGLDLGKDNKYIVTRVRFCPRSDTNFILEGDRYELKYWDGEWKSAGIQVAKEPIISFEQVPSGSLYILHNQSRGKEERIFTFEDGKQVWW